LTETQDPAPLTTKGEQTRVRILEVALDLFRERGYQETTMRAIADAAGVSLGNAYYYFKSKDHLVHAFYTRTHEAHLVECADVLDRESDVSVRLLGVMRAKLATIEPYHRFSGQLFRTAADPGSPLSPFSAESLPVRRESTRVFERVLEGKGLRVSKELRPELPNLLWLYHMGVILFWLHDRSPGRRRSYRLVESTVPFILQLVSLGSLPIVRSFARRGVDLLREFREEEANGSIVSPGSEGAAT
jgi:AcrR family transcriptional regulator